MVTGPLWNEQRASLPEGGKHDIYPTTGYTLMITENHDNPVKRRRTY